jgi:hypothetical protein
MSAAKCVGSDEKAKVFPDRSQAVEDAEHASLLGSGRNRGRGACRWSTSSSWRKTNSSRSLDREERHLSKSRRRICRRLIAARRKAKGLLSRCDARNVGGRRSAS